MADADVIFAGGGTTACVVAGRLAAADPSLKILARRFRVRIIEAGKHSQDVKTHVQPARFLANLKSGGDSFTFHVAQPSNALDGRQCIVPAGKVVGGGSCVNFMMYTRCSESDMDDWENLGNPGWGSKDLIPLANKAETCNLPSHGTNGPIQITAVSKTDDMQLGVTKQFLAVAAARDPERGIVPDANDFSPSSINKYSPWSRYVNPQTGKRSDTAHHYIYNQSHNNNIQVLTQCRVKRVIFDGDRTVGVEYTSHHPDAKDQQTAVIVKASKLVVLSSGAFGSPAILERSGIGAKNILAAHGIPQLVDLPGVGENYNDHNLLMTPYHAPADEITLSEIFHGSEDALKAHEDRWLQDGQGLMAHNGIEAAIKIRPNAKDLELLGAQFHRRWESFFESQPDKPIMCFGPMAGYTGGNPEARGHEHFGMVYYIQYPASIGRVHIQSPDPHAPLAFEPGYLDKPEDVALLRWSYKWTREVARRMDSYRGEFAADHPQFPPSSAAICRNADGPVPISAPDLKYTSEDDAAIDKFHRARVGTAWHSLGTCAMKPRADGGVVDSFLSVYGVKGLKIADLSIVPTNVSTNTYSTALMVGEKAAVIIAEELGISGV
ncbi:GMC-OxRdtase-N domain-containing protein [Mycena chlorophos]|uniref:GMC-OxRdtase-N domain-containing protein n=1 Tax=Mycena chlorophos TaxID=658473 RepID=A0A8H6WGF8_MYCCL|nr:GMC-OxRdtase-N domain-containing protein [Mycena chlorophos]